MAGSTAALFIRRVVRRGIALPGAWLTGCAPSVCLLGESLALGQEGTLGGSWTADHRMW